MKVAMLPLNRPVGPPSFHILSAVLRKELFLLSAIIMMRSLQHSQAKASFIFYLTPGGIICGVNCSLTGRRVLLPSSTALQCRAALSLDVVRSSVWTAVQMKTGLELTSCKATCHKAATEMIC